MKKNTLKENIIAYLLIAFMFVISAFIVGFIQEFVNCRIFNKCPSKNRIDRQRLLEWEMDDLRESMKKRDKKMEQLINDSLIHIELPEVNLID